MCVMFVYGGRVHEVQSAVDESAAQLVTLCARHHQAHVGQWPGQAELDSWRESWPELVHTLTEAGLGELQLFLEYELLGSAQRVDAIVLGARPDGGLTAVLIELKRWSSCTRASAALAWVLDREYTHPCRQVSGYVSYFEEWLDEPGLDLQLRAVAFMHKASADVVGRLRSAVEGSVGSGDVSLIGQDDLRITRDPSALAALLRCEGLEPPKPAQIEQFVEARQAPAVSVFERLGDMLRGDPSFRLVGGQQDAQLSILNAVATAQPDTRHVIVVTGGPGTGKTVVGTRLLTDIPKVCRWRGRPVSARFMTPSGTLRHQLTRAAGEVPGARPLFVNLDMFAGRRTDRPEITLVDEAQRMSRYGKHMRLLLRRGPICVFFLDERQVIRPREGFTADEMKAEAMSLGATFTRLDLTSQFRCGGSQHYLTWLEQLFHGAAKPWRGDDYDIEVASDPDQLEQWVSEHGRAGYQARTAAGFCWPWSDPENGELPQDVSLDWTAADGTRKAWAKPWNVEEAVLGDDGSIVPKREYWATDPGGEGQIGCVYTCQGLEYDYGGVIMGKDLVRRGDIWVAQPERSEDPNMKKHRVGADEYLRLAANTYWVLASRAKYGSRLYSDDVETQSFLQSLFVS
jgi:hypothetical protein